MLEARLRPCVQQAVAMALSVAATCGIGCLMHEKDGGGLTAETHFVILANIKETLGYEQVQYRHMLEARRQVQGVGASRAFLDRPATHGVGALRARIRGTHAA